MAYRKQQQVTAFNWNEYFDNLKERAKATFVINDSGEGYYLYEGVKWTEKDFNKLIPIKLIRSNLKGENVDGTHVKE